MSSTSQSTISIVASLRKTFSIRSQNAENPELGKAARDVTDKVADVTLDTEEKQKESECIAETQELEFINELKFSPCR